MATRKKSAKKGSKGPKKGARKRAAALQFRAVCKSGDYAGPARSTELQATNDALSHDKSGHIVIVVAIQSSFTVKKTKKGPKKRVAAKRRS